MIFYFSGTGNTQWVARKLAEATGEELRYIPDELQKDSLVYELKEGERLGFCFPTHGWQPPRIVRQFIHQSSFKNATYVYAITTCGDNMGDAILGLLIPFAVYGFVESMRALHKKSKVLFE